MRIRNRKKNDEAATLDFAGIGFVNSFYFRYQISAFDSPVLFILLGRFEDLFLLIFFIPTEKTKGVKIICKITFTPLVFLFMVAAVKLFDG